MLRVSPHVFRLLGAALVLLATAVTCRSEEGAASGAAITPQFAQALYERLLPLRESDGCRLARFDTMRSFISVGLHAPSGSEHVLQIAAGSGSGAARLAGGWAISFPAQLETDCAATLAAIEKVLAETSTPRDAPWRADRWTSVRANYSLLAASFVLLAAWTIRVLHRELKAQPPPPYAVPALFVVWLVALALRLFLSPQTFLHEYYHIAETLPGYLKGETGPVYGDTGPALFQLAAAMLRRPEDFRIIFLTNAVLASLAIPAVALLALVVTRRWPHALSAAVLLCVLPHHLRFSASEVLFVQAVTFALWSLALFALYVRTRRLEDAFCGTLALSLAMQTRPEMLFFPVALVALLLLTEPRSWRLLFDWRTLLALLALGLLLVPRFFELRQVLAAGGSRPPDAPDLQRYLNGLVLFREDAMPWVYRPLLVAGALWGLWRIPGLVVWVALVFVGYTFLCLSIFDNTPYNLRSQVLPMSFLVLIAAGSASLWTAMWGRRRRPALAIGACLLALFGVAVVVESHGFVTELQDQQLEWAFLERTVPRLPQEGTLLTAAQIGGRNLAAFPQFLLQRDGKSFELVDVRQAAAGEESWPPPGEDVLFYQGMFCYFAFPDEPSPDPMTPVCSAVHQRYVTEPLFVEELHTTGYSPLVYAPGPYRIGFLRLSASR